MNFTECTESRGNPQLLEHKSKVIYLPCSPWELSQCQQGLCRKCTELCPAWGMQSQGLSRQEKLLSQGNNPAQPGPDLHPSLPECPMDPQPPEQQGWTSRVPHTAPIASPAPQTRNPLGFQHMLNPLFPPAVLGFFNHFLFSKEDPSAPHPIPARQEQKLLFLM